MAEHPQGLEFPRICPEGIEPSSAVSVCEIQPSDVVSAVHCSDGWEGVLVQPILVAYIHHDGSPDRNHDTHCHLQIWIFSLIWVRESASHVGVVSAHRSEAFEDLLLESGGDKASLSTVHCCSGVLYRHDVQEAAVDLVQSIRI